MGGSYLWLVLYLRNVIFNNNNKQIALLLLSNKKLKSDTFEPVSALLTILGLVLVDRVPKHSDPRKSATIALPNLEADKGKVHQATGN